MKKALALLMVLAMALCVTACGKDKTEGVNSSDNSSGISASDVATSSDESSNDKDTTSTESKTESVSSDKKNDTSKTTSTVSKNTTAQTNPEVRPSPAPTPTPETTQPAFLNPKTNFKYGKYVAKYLSDDKKIYNVVSIYFHEDFEGTQFTSIPYYSEAAAIEKYNEWGSTFDPNDFSEREKITVNGTTYYNLDIGGGIAEAYKMTDENIKISPDVENWTTLILNTDGTLAIKETQNGNRYGKVGTVYTFVPEE